MFELPNAKRVKRSKLFSSFSSEDEGDAHDTTTIARKSLTNKQESKSEPMLQGHKNRRSKTVADDENDADEPSDSMKIDYGFQYEFVDKESAPLQPNRQNRQNPPPLSGTTANENSTKPAEQDEPSHEQSYEFNLFAPKPRTATIEDTTTPQPTQTSQDQKNQTKQTITIRSRSPTPTISAGGITHPRPRSHYFTTPTTPTQREAYKTAAVTGSQVTDHSHTLWTGTHLPWRVVHIPSSSGPKTTPLPPPTTTNNRHQCARPSKKRRILLRRRVAARVALVEQSQKDEVAEREKRTRRNREKKVKRKAREKAKKAAVVDGDVDMDADAGGSGSGSGSGDGSGE